MKQPTDGDIWRRVLSCLTTALTPGDRQAPQAATIPLPPGRRKAAPRAPARAGRAVEVQRHIRIIERRTPSTLTVSWCDATTGRYGDQVWIMAISKKNAICALTGRLIARGTSVYKPRFSRLYVPRNHDQMILACVVPSGDVAASLKHA